MKLNLLLTLCALFGMGAAWGQYYEPVIKPTMDSISWRAWTRYTEEDLVSYELYVMRDTSSISLLYENGGYTHTIGQLREDNGQLWITYTVCNVIENVCNEHEVLLMDMSLSVGDEYVLPTGSTIQVSDVLYQDGRKVIVFASTTNNSEWREPLMFIEGVGPNFLSIDGPSEMFGTFISCKFEDEALVYSTQNPLFTGCELKTWNAKEWYFNLSSFMGSPISYYKMEVLGDTVVQGHTCSIITPPYIGGNGGNQYVYEENRVVHWYNVTTNTFTTLYDFNANEGDSWICDIDSCSYQVTVTSIDSVTWDGHTYRVQNVTSHAYLTSDDCFTIMQGRIIDGIGYEEGLFPYMLACDYVVYDGAYPNYLRCYLKDGEMLYHEGSYYCDEKQKTDRWIFPLAFTDATNNPDTVWFVQHDYVTTLEDILNEEGINPNVSDEDSFRVYFMQDGVKTRVVSTHFDEAFTKENIYADNYKFPITMDWRKILLEQYFEFFGPMAFTSLESAYTQSGYTIEGVEVYDVTEWYGVFNTYETTGPQPAAVFSEEGTYYGNEEMLQSFYNYQTFFPLSVSMSRSCLYHLGSLSGVSASVDGHEVTISWSYHGCDNPQYFIITRITGDESDYEVFTTTETTFTDHDVPAGNYIYKLDGYYGDGQHITDNPPYYYGVDVTIEPDFASQGFEWYYELQNPDGSVTYQHLYYLADTVIDDRDIDIIVRNNTLYDKGVVTTHEYIYEENGKVYWWNATTGDFTTLYDFTAIVGDEWEIKVGTESITMHVDAVGETEFNGKTFKTLQVSDAGNLFSGTIVASVGHLTSLFPEKLMRKTGGSTVEGLRCLWNGTELVFKYGDKDCDEVYEQLHDGMGEATTIPFSLYPNPTEGQLSVSTASGGYYRIANLVGQTLQQGSLNCGSTSLDVSALGKGMYFLTIEGASQKFVIDK